MAHRPTHSAHPRADEQSQLAEFMAALDEINARAEATAGFIWRLQSDSGNATDIQVSEDPNFLVNMSVWATNRVAV